VKLIPHPVTGDWLIRAATAAVVAAVALDAAVVSYSHVYDLGRLHGQSGTAGRLLPLAVDGLIVAASLLLLYEARKGILGWWFARGMLGLGVGATVAGNVLYGIRFGALGAVVSAWPAVSFVGSAEMCLRLVRSARSGAALPKVARDAESAAMAAYAASVAGGNPLSGRQLEARFGLNRAQVARIRTAPDESAAAHA